MKISKPNNPANVALITLCVVLVSVLILSLVLIINSNKKENTLSVLEVDPTVLANSAATRDIGCLDFKFTPSWSQQTATEEESNNDAYASYFVGTDQESTAIEYFCPSDNVTSLADFANLLGQQYQTTELVVDRIELNGQEANATTFTLDDNRVISYYWLKNNTNLCVVSYYGLDADYQKYLPEVYASLSTLTCR